MNAVIPGDSGGTGNDVIIGDGGSTGIAQNGSSWNAGNTGDPGSCGNTVNRQ